MIISCTSHVSLSNEKRMVCIGTVIKKLFNKIECKMIVWSHPKMLQRDNVMDYIEGIENDFMIKSYFIQLI
jgi:hypothetical protein